MQGDTLVLSVGEMNEKEIWLDFNSFPERKSFAVGLRDLAKRADGGGYDLQVKWRRNDDRPQKDVHRLQFHCGLQTRLPGLKVNEDGKIGSMTLTASAGNWQHAKQSLTQPLMEEARCHESDECKISIAQGKTCQEAQVTLTFTVPEADVNVSRRISYLQDFFTRKDSKVRAKCRNLSFKWWHKPLEEREKEEVCAWIRQLIGHEQSARLREWISSENLDGRAFLQRLIEGMPLQIVAPAVLDKVCEHVGLGQNSAKASLRPS